MQKEMVKAINAAIDEVIADTYDNRDNRFFVLCYDFFVLTPSESILDIDWTC